MCNRFGRTKKLAALAAGLCAVTVGALWILFPPAAEQSLEGRLTKTFVGRSDNRESVTVLEHHLADYRELGQRGKQLETAAALLQLDPESPKRWADLLELQSSMARDSDCLTTIRQALQHDFPAEFRGYLRNSLVQQLVNGGDVLAARRELEELRKQEGDSTRVCGLDVYVSRLEGDLEKSLQIVTRIVDDAPDLPFPRFTRGIIHLDLRKFKEAIEDLKAVVAAQQFNGPAHFKLSEAYRALGRDELATAHRQTASEIAGRQVRVSLLLKQREANPDDRRICDELAQLHRDLGQLDAAKMWKGRATRIALPK